MNYYERIQKSIDFIESNLENDIDVEKFAQVAWMSCSNYYRMFFALTGYAVKEYIRCRRMSCAAATINETSINLLDLALKYGFASNEAFTRAFKRVTGYPPSAFRKNGLHYRFERMNVLDKYFDAQDTELLEKYPDIRVLKELEPFRVAYYCYYGAEPERGAFAVMNEWMKQSGLNFEKDKLRIFGFNNPSPAGLDQTAYGYEVWVTISNDLVVNDGLVKSKTFQGGLYAVCEVKNLSAGENGSEIHDTWQRFITWVNESRYTVADHQWLEEHLLFNEEFEHIGGMDLYMPIAQKASITGLEKEIVFVDPMQTQIIIFNGPKAYDEALTFMFNFFNHPSNDSLRAFCYYNFERAGRKDFWCKVHLLVEDDVKASAFGLQREVFEGGQYAYEEVEWKNNSTKWYQLIDWVKRSMRYDFDNRPFMEEYIITSPAINTDTRVKHYMPVKNR